MRLYRIWLSLCALYAGLAPALWVIRFRAMPLASGENLWVCSSSAWWRSRPVGLLAAAGLAATGAYFAWRERRAAEGPRIFTPLALLPLTAAPLLYAHRWPPLAVALGLLLPVLACASLVTLRAMEDLDRRGADWPRCAPRFILIALALFFFLGGWHLTRAIGRHSGDEGHYLAQAESLRRDSDLDIRNQLPAFAQAETAVARHAAHISPRSRDGHWYSWHAFGLSALLVPFLAGGDAGLHAALAAISLSGLFAAYRTARQAGARRAAGALVVALFGLGFLWSGYSMRALPEVLGAALLAWLFWAVWNAEVRPRMSLVVALLCGQALLWANTRFIPLAGVAAGWWLLTCLLPAPPAPRPWRRALLFCALNLLGLALYAAVQWQLFAALLPRPGGGVLLAKPIGAVLTFVSRTGLLYSLPAFAWLLVAHLVWLRDEPRHRRWAAGVLAVIAANLVFSAMSWFGGGIAIPGRHHVCTALLLLPAAAVIFDRGARIVRLGFLLPAACGIALTALMLLHAERLQNWFIMPIPGAGLVEPRWSALHGPLHFPAGSLAIAGVEIPSRILGGALWLLAACAALLLARRQPRWGGALSAAALFALLGLSLRTGMPVKPLPLPAHRVAELLAGHEDAVFPQPLAHPVPVWQVSDVLTGRPGRSLYPGFAAGDVPQQQPAAEVGDLAAWHPLVRPFPQTPGRYLLRVDGMLREAARLQVLCHQHGHTRAQGEIAARPDGSIDTVLNLEVLKDDGSLHVVARLPEGRGSFTLTGLHLAPYGKRYEAAGLRRHP